MTYHVLHFCVIARDDSVTKDSEMIQESTCKEFVNEKNLAAPDLADLSEPSQPNLKSFLSRKFGKDKSGKEIKRSFKASWYLRHKWIHYDVENDAAFCFTCIKATCQNLITTKKSEDTFIKRGFTNWKKALEKGRGFDKNEKSESHREATDRLVVIPNTSKRDIGELISESYYLEKFNNRQMLLKIMENIRFLGNSCLTIEFIRFYTKRTRSILI